MPSLDRPFAEWLSNFTMQRGLTQEALANEIGVSHVTVGKWMHGTHLPEPQYLRAICEAHPDVNIISLFQLCGYFPPDARLNDLSPKALALLTLIGDMDDISLDSVLKQITILREYGLRKAEAEEDKRKHARTPKQ